MSDIALSSPSLETPTPHVTSVPAPDAVAGLVELLEQLSLQTGDASPSDRVLHDLRHLPWAEQDPEVLRLLGQVARAYLELATERDQVQQLLHGLEHLATHDALTGLPNRTLVLDRLQHAMASAARTGATVAVLYVDVDAFKQINDTLGHATGDLVLVEIARRLRRATRTGDTLGRMSGDEFVVVCENLPGSSSQVASCMDVLAQRFVDVLSLPSESVGPEVVVSASIGAAIGTAPHSLGAEELLREADAAMYVAKRSGGGRLVVSEPRWGAHAVPSQQLVAESRR